MLEEDDDDEEEVLGRFGGDWERRYECFAVDTVRGRSRTWHNEMM